MDLAGVRRGLSQQGDRGPGGDGPATAHIHDPVGQARHHGGRGDGGRHVAGVDEVAIRRQRAHRDRRRVGGKRRPQQERGPTEQVPLPHPRPDRVEHPQRYPVDATRPGRQLDQPGGGQVAQPVRADRPRDVGLVGRAFVRHRTVLARRAQTDVADGVVTGRDRVEQLGGGHRVRLHQFGRGPVEAAGAVDDRRGPQVEEQGPDGVDIVGEQVAVGAPGARQLIDPGVTHQRVPHVHTQKAGRAEENDVAHTTSRIRARSGSSIGRRLAKRRLASS